MSTTSGRNCWICACALAPSLITSSSLICACAFRQPADVLGNLRHVLDDQQARLVAGCHRGDDTKFRSRHVPPNVRVASGPTGTDGYVRIATRTARSLPGP